MSYDMILRNYRRGLWTRQMVEMAVRAGLITRDQAEQIYREA